MDNIMVNATVPTVTLGAAQTCVSGPAFASVGDVSRLKGIDVSTDAFATPGVFAWSPPS